MQQPHSKPNLLVPFWVDDWKNPRMRNSNWRARAAQAREERKITLEALAEKLDMSVPGIQKWLNGSRQPNLEDIFRISSALDVSPVWLIHGLEVDDMLDGLGEPARQTLRRLIHAERAGPLSEAIWNIVKSAADVAQPESGPAVTPTVQRVLEAKLSTESRDLYRQKAASNADESH